MRALLVEEVAALRPLPEARPEDERAEDEPAESATGTRSQASEADGHLTALAKARRRAWAVVVLDWAAILVLLLTYRDPEPFLSLGGSPRTIFSLGILAIAVHSGFRLAQLQSYRRIAEVCQELAERSDEG